ncbi:MULTISPECIES: hypothetical protein [Halobacterium]|uniref:hypothetical protein n=1 Tax=Halobacterium TaxID=2239 RepID=UPI00073EC214|nr:MULTISPECIES: hypothetical protein [Halobacterium]MCG1003222.1 hypothetical protein [Halobacterium noricense]
MGFDDLEAAEQDRADRGDEPPAPERDDDRASDSEGTATADASTDGDAASSATSEEPAFEYDDVKQAPMYARPESWTALEDALDLDVVRTLREAGVRNEEKRELHDAVLRVAADHPDEIADAVREARDED